MNKYIRIVVLMALPFLIGAVEFSDYTTLINQKMMTERRLEEHLGGIVSRIVGEGKSTIIVSVELSDMTKSRVQTEQWLEKAKEEIITPQQEEFLPGIPLKSVVEEKKAGSPEKSGGKKVEDILTLPAEFIESVRISVILDKSVPDDVVATIEKVIDDVMDLNPAKGDRLTIQRVGFAERSVDLVSFLFNPYFYIITLVLVTLAIIGLFLFGPLRRFLFATLQTLKDLKGIKQEMEYSGTGGPGGGGGVGVASGMGTDEMEFEEEEDIESLEDLEAEDTEAEKALEDTEKTQLEEEFEKMSYKPLKFLEDKDLKKLAYLLNFEKPEVGALLINYLEPDKGAKVMAAIPTEKRVQVAKNVVKIQRASKEVMEHIDEFLSKKIDYVAGGADKLISVLEMMSEEDRERLFDDLSEDDPEFAEKVREKIFSFEDVIKLDDSSIQIVIQEVETRDLGVALKTASDEVKQKFISNMSEGAAALLKEEIEFGKKVSGTQIKAKQVEIISKIKMLESEGLIAGIAGGGDEELWREEIGEDEKEGVLEKIIKAAQHALDEKENLELAAGEDSLDKGGDDELSFQFYEQGLEAYKQEDYDTAIRYFNQSIKYNPNIWQSHQYIGSSYLALGDEENAKEAYEKALELNPENTQLREWLESH